LVDVGTWNIRDEHFLHTVRMVVDHMGRQAGAAPKVVVWAHNSHLGDARATDMGWRRNELNVGQLLRQAYGTELVVNVGFTTHTGTVTAADNWNEPADLKTVRMSMPGSYERLLHSAGLPAFLLDFRHGADELKKALHGPLLERAIGVVYKPRTERQSHYFYAELPSQFDIVVHLDETKALQPLEKVGPWATDKHIREDAPETYPFGV
jgi:erythromycin esterase-like protein